MIILKRIGLALLIVLIFSAMVVFTAANPGDVAIHFLHWENSWPVSYVLTGAFAVGWIFGLICMGVYALKMSRERNKLRRALNMSQTEVSSLRSLPMNDAD